MSAELPQSAVSAAGQKASAAIASGVVTAGTGASTYLELLPAILGSVASAVGIVVSCGLFHLAWKKNRLERKLLHQQIAAMDAKEAERNQNGA